MTSTEGRPAPGEPDSKADSPPFATTLLRVMSVQVIALVLLWLLQARYHG
ncbi:MAG: hypothetical protein ACR2QM_11035 [Longimicrobiales bacterium]